MSAFSDFCACMENSGLIVAFRVHNPAQWQSVLDFATYVPVLYTSAMLDYQVSYFQGFDASCIDASVIIFHDQKPIAVWPIMLSSTASDCVISTAGDGIASPLFVAGVSEKTQKTIVSKCHAVACEYTKNQKKDCYAGIEAFNPRSFGLSQWYIQAIRLGAAASIKHDMYVDLDKSFHEIKALFRKSYKSLISLGERLWSVHLCLGDSQSVWEEFRMLHLKVAGRRTRSDESWTYQYAAILAGNAFLVYLRDHAGNMVGGGFFHLSQHEGVYAVGAYDRALFDKPLGHVIQARAIQEMQRKGLMWYKIGMGAYPGDCPAPTEKELTISHFKQGFCTHYVARPEFVRNIVQS